jgi:hypothetical protein
MPQEEGPGNCFRACRLDDYLKLEHLVVLAKAKALAGKHG